MDHGNGVVLDEIREGDATSFVPDDLQRLTTVVTTLDSMDDDERARCLALVNARFKRPATPARGRRRA